MKDINNSYKFLRGILPDFDPFIISPEYRLKLVTKALFRAGYDESTNMYRLVRQTINFNGHSNDVGGRLDDFVREREGIPLEKRANFVKALAETLKDELRPEHTSYEKLKKGVEEFLSNF